jgi:small subunit ribosomal protein S13
MAKEKEIKKEESPKKEVSENKEKRRPAEGKNEGKLVRVLGKDLRGEMKVSSGLTKIPGISWAFSNAICKSLKIEKDKKIQEISEEEMKVLEEFVKNPELPGFLKNRQKDLEGGEDKHVSGSDLKLRKEFDIKRLRKIKSYRGNRHALGLPVRGQRTKSNFRKNRAKSGAVGVKKK